MLTFQKSKDSAAISIDKHRRFALWVKEKDVFLQTEPDRSNPYSSFVSQNAAAQPKRRVFLADDSVSDSSDSDCIVVTKPLVGSIVEKAPE